MTNDSARERADADASRGEPAPTHATDREHGARAPSPRAEVAAHAFPPLAFALALFAVAFLLRVLAARTFAGEPVWDGHYYDFGARRIAEGHGYSDDRTVDGVVEWHPWCHYPVGYSAFLAGFYRVLGAHSWVAHVANALIGALTAVVVHLLGREGLSERRARIAGLLTALHPGLILYSALVMGEVLSAFTVLTAFWIALRGSRAVADAPSGLRRVSGVGLGALVLGIGVLVRPQALLCAPFLALAIPLRPPRSLALGARLRRWAPRLTVVPLACALALVPVLPWTARNCRVMDGCALVSTNAGWNLAIGSFPRATGRFETLRSSDGCREVTGQVQQDRCWLEYGLANIRRTPGRWLGLIPAKLSNTFDHESFAIEYLREARPGDWPEPRRIAWRAMLSAVHRVLLATMPLAFVAFALGRPVRRRVRIVQSFLAVAVAVAGIFAISASTPTVWPIVIAGGVLPLLPLPGRPAALPVLQLLVALMTTTALTHAIFFGDDRYHVIVTPALCLLAAAALRRPRPSATDGASLR